MSPMPNTPACLASTLPRPRATERKLEINMHDPLNEPFSTERLKRHTQEPLLRSIAVLFRFSPSKTLYAQRTQMGQVTHST